MIVSVILQSPSKNIYPEIIYSLSYDICRYIILNILDIFPDHFGRVSATQQQPRTHRMNEQFRNKHMLRNDVHVAHRILRLKCHMRRSRDIPLPLFKWGDK